MSRNTTSSAMSWPEDIMDYSKKIMDGHRLASEIKEKVRMEVAELNSYGIEVGLALMLVGDNKASLQYFHSTVKACRRVGIKVHEYRLPGDSSTNEILNSIHAINSDERISGLLVLFPLPLHINPRRVVNALVPEKDIDGLGAVSVGRLAAEESLFQIFLCNNHEAPKENTLYKGFQSLLPCTYSGFLPCTPYGVVRLLEYYGVQLKGKNAVVLGKSLAVGKPLALMLLSKDVTVSICHKSTDDPEYYLRHADIVCSATGVKGLIKGHMIKEGAVVIDIGINVLEDGTIAGDVDFDSVIEKASLVTPVPGGVGPVTIAMLLENTLRSAQRNELVNSPLILH